MRKEEWSQKMRGETISRDHHQLHRDLPMLMQASKAAQGYALHIHLVIQKDKVMRPVHLPAAMHI